MSTRTADVERLRHALASSSDEVQFTATLPRGTARKLLTLLTEERKRGAIVVPARSEFRASEAAVIILGISRADLARLIEQGQIEARQVGVHWRIPADALIAFQEERAEERATRMDRLAEFENQAGLE